MKIKAMDKTQNNKCSFKNSNPIPRYLYHMTSAENLNKIQANGFIRPQGGGIAGPNIYLFELNNFVSKWHQIIFDYFRAVEMRTKGSSEPLFFNIQKLMKKKEVIEAAEKSGQPREAIVRNIYPNTLIDALLAKINPTLETPYVVLKIPARDLDMVNLRVRDQLKLCNFVRPKGKTISREEFNMLYGDIALNAKKHKMRGEAIEYLYGRPIRIEDIEVAGSIDKATMARIFREAPPPNILRKLVEAMFSGEGQKKAAAQIPPIIREY